MASGPKTLRNELHHWWPRSLSSFWVNPDGYVHSVSCTGDLVKSLPKAFGAVRNANNINMADVPTVWDQSFEGTFGKADSSFPALIEWLRGLPAESEARAGPFCDRIHPVIVPPAKKALLGECLASLIGRSPSFRSRVEIAAGAMRARFGLPDPKPDKALIGLKVRGAQRMLSEAIIPAGKFAVLISDDAEFVLGGRVFSQRVLC